MRKIKNVYIRYTFIENKERRVTFLFAFSISIPSRRSQVWLPSSRVVQFRDTDCLSVTLIIDMELFAIITTKTKYWTKVSKYILNSPRHYSPQISSFLTSMSQNFFHFIIFLILTWRMKLFLGDKDLICLTVTRRIGIRMEIHNFLAAEKWNSKKLSMSY